MDATSEAFLWGAISNQDIWFDAGEAYPRPCTPRTVLNKMAVVGLIASVKQGWATLEKWDARGLYSWGVTADLGWIEMGAEFYRWGDVDPSRLMEICRVYEQ